MDLNSSLHLQHALGSMESMLFSDKFEKEKELSIEFINKLHLKTERLESQQEFRMQECFDQNTEKLIKFKQYDQKYEYFLFYSKMTQSPSKLSAQLSKQLKDSQEVEFQQERVDGIFEILAKSDQKNLMLAEYLAFMIEKGFIKNQHKLHYFFDLYERIKSSNEQPIITQKAKGQEDDERFHKQKFVRSLRQMGKKFYPCDAFAFQSTIYKTILSNDHSDEVRIKIDDFVKKILVKDTINLFRNFQRELEIIFQIYLPENFNSKMGFTWQEIKYLDKKLPIIAVYRFLWDSEICPLYLTASNYIEIASKLIPPHSLLNPAGQKESLFYSPDNIMNYSKDAIFQKKMKLLDGDMGVSFLEFQMLLARLSIQVTKQKNDFCKSLQSFFQIIKLKEIISSRGDTKGKPSKFEQNVKIYFEESRKGGKGNFQLQKPQTKKKIEEIFQINEKVSEDSRTQFKDASITINDLLAIKKSIDDDHLPVIPQRVHIQKENDQAYSIQEKHIVIGQQLPKIPEKNKPVAPQKKNDKKDDNLNKYKPEATTNPKLSSDYYNEIAKAPTKYRINSEIPIVIMDIIYPSDIPNLYLNPKSQIYLQTTYIFLGERSYQKAFVNYVKARSLCENSKNQTTQFFFLILEAQIYEAAARDGMALLNYHRAKQLSLSMPSKDNMLKYYAYKGLACCLYHMQQYQISLRCFLKARELRVGQIQLQSVENAVLQNNIGCIFMILNRNNEAMKHFSLSEKIFDLKLGKFHERSVIVQQNQRKNKKAYIQMAPQYKTVWKAYAEKPNIKSSNKGNKK